MLKTICYLSNQREKLSLLELEKLYEQTLTNNITNNITGALLLIKSQFIQVIEGEEAVIDTLFKTISEDTRHQHIIVINDSIIEKRLFTNFDSNYSIIDNFEKLVIFKDYIEQLANKHGDSSFKALVAILDDIVRIAV